MRTQPEEDLAAMRSISSAVRIWEPGWACAIGTDSTVVAIAPIVCSPCVETLAPIAPPGW